MEFILLFFILNVAGYIFWRIHMNFEGYDIQHETVINFLVTLLFFMPLKFGGYLDIEEQ